LQIPIFKRSCLWPSFYGLDIAGGTTGLHHDDLDGLTSKIDKRGTKEKKKDTCQKTLTKDTPG
jgi:hypothetical protein